MFDPFAKDATNELEIRVAYAGGRADSESAKQPPVPEAPYQPYAEESSLNEPPYEPYARKPAQPEPPYEPYKDI